jgi:hypothetical protein
LPVAGAKAPECADANFKPPVLVLYRYRIQTERCDYVAANETIVKRKTRLCDENFSKAAAVTAIRAAAVMETLAGGAPGTYS